MQSGKQIFSTLILVILLFDVSPLSSQERGLKSIAEKELRIHLEFIAADEFRGRETPSAELEICNLYLANLIKSYGLKSLMPDSSYYQRIPITVTDVSEAEMVVASKSNELVFNYQQSFGGRFSTSGVYRGDVVFVGYGLSDPEKGWDDYKDIDLAGKVVVMLDGKLPDDNELNTRENRLWYRTSAFREKGAQLVLTIIHPNRENKRVSGGNIFYNTPRGRLETMYESQRRGRSPSQTPPRTGQSQNPDLPFARAEISHDVASVILDIPKNEISDMFKMISSGQQVAGSTICNKCVELTVKTETRPEATRSVLGLVEGSDRSLKNEYIVICAHQDHLGVRNGEIIAGADDNGSGTVALLEIAQALMIERPKRSVIIAWFTGEERGYIGSQYFVNNCPVPIENISTCLNMDMLCRNHPDSLYLVASDLLSFELDRAIHEMNKEHNINFEFSYVYSNRTHPQRVYYRSDQYPHIRFGIPSVWFFCGFTPDYHTPRDVIDFVDYNKMLKVTRLVYTTALEIGNMKELLKLDVNPDVTRRGKHNVYIESIK